MIAAITSVGKRELMREARIAMRTIDAAHEGQNVADDDLKRMANAAERVTSCKQKREKEQAAAEEWLTTKRYETGLAALANLLGVDAANL
jgi:hypothetical protein